VTERFNYPRPVPERFSRTGCRMMKAVITTGNGSYDKLEYRDVPVPEVLPGTVLVKVLAAGVNNTEINTRLGWYSETVQAGTNATEEVEDKHATEKADGGWNLPTPFPFIQGTDCCGVAVEAYPGEDQSLLGKRGLVRPCMRPLGFQSMENIWMGSDFDGAFAEYVLVPAGEFFPINSTWTDIELGSILGEESVDVVIDNVGGAGFPAMLKVLKRGGAYVSSGAIGGPVVSLDLRTWYLKDIRMIGCTAWDEPVFPNLISYLNPYKSIQVSSSQGKEA